MRQISLKFIRAKLDTMNLEGKRVKRGFFEYFIDLVLSKLTKDPEWQIEGRYYTVPAPIPKIIGEMLSDNCQILLSEENRKVIIYDVNSESYREAAYDIPKGQPIPTNNIFQLNGNIPLNSLEVIKFGSQLSEPKERAGAFLEKVLLFDAPIIEIGEHKGDMHIRYFSVKKYSE